MTSGLRIACDLLPERLRQSARWVRGSADPPITIRAETVGDTRMVWLAGELDTTSRTLVTRRCTEGRTRHVIVDLAGLTFLDCGGYGGLVEAWVALGQQGRTLTVIGAVGEPRRLVDLIHLLESKGPDRRVEIERCGHRGPN